MSKYFKNEDSRSVGLGWRLRFCISNKLPGNATDSIPSCKTLGNSCREFRTKETQLLLSASYASRRMFRTEAQERGLISLPTTCAHSSFPCFLSFLRYRVKKFISGRFKFIFYLLFFTAPRGMWFLVVPRPGIEPLHSALEVRSFNHWTAMEILISGRF